MGVIDAESADMAENILASRGYIPTRVTEEGGGKPSGLAAFSGGVKVADIIIFTKQLRSMLKAGIPIMRILSVLEAQTENPKLKTVTAAVSLEIKNGSSFSDALGKHPEVFSDLYLGMIMAGETSGSVPEILTRIINIMEHEEKVKSDIKSALQYPIIVVFALGIAFFILLTFVIPVFAKVFEKANLTLPLPTKIAIGLHHLLVNWWPILILAVAAVIAGLSNYFKTDEGKFQRDGLFIRVPVIGELVVKSAMSRFASIFAILHGSGVPITKTLTILAGTIGNAAIARDFEYVRNKMEEGQGLAEPLKSTRYFTPMVVDMIAIGEESGSLDDMLKEITKHYDDEVAYAVKGLSDALGPFLIVGLAFVVGFFALAIFMPMWDMTKMVRPH